MPGRDSVVFECGLERCDSQIDDAEANNLFDRNPTGGEVEIVEGYRWRMAELERQWALEMMPAPKGGCARELFVFPAERGLTGSGWSKRVPVLGRPELNSMVLSLYGITHLCKKEIHRSEFGV
jgi:hypothetical protein